MTKKFLAIIPENAAPPALIGEALLEMGHAYDAIYPIDRYASHSPLSYTGLPSEPGAYAGLIMMGGPMSANDVADHAFLEESMSLIRSFGLAKKPVLGMGIGTLFTLFVLPTFYTLLATDHREAKREGRKSEIEAVS